MMTKTGSIREPLPGDFQVMPKDLDVENSSTIPVSNLYEIKLSIPTADVDKTKKLTNVFYNIRLELYRKKESKLLKFITLTTRESAFKDLDRQLREKFGSQMINIQLPSKKFFASDVAKPEVIEEKRAKLQQYLLSISEIPEIQTSDIFELFIHKAVLLDKINKDEKQTPDSSSSHAINIRTKTIINNTTMSSSFKNFNGKTPNFESVPRARSLSWGSGLDAVVSHTKIEKPREHYSPVPLQKTIKTPNVRPNLSFNNPLSSSNISYPIEISTPPPNFKTHLTNWINSVNVYRGISELDIEDYFLVEMTSVSNKKTGQWHAVLLVFGTHQLYIVEQAKALLLLKKTFLYHDLLSVSIDTSHAMVKVQVALHPQRDNNVYLFHCTRNSIAIDVSECFVKYMQKAFDLERNLKDVFKFKSKGSGVNLRVAKLSNKKKLSPDVILKKFNVSEENVWDGNTDLLGLMSHLKQNQQDIVSRDKDRIFMVTIALPEIAEFSTRKTFSLQVLLTWDISTVFETMCNRMFASEEIKGGFCLTTVKGMCLNEKLTLGDYGLGVLFFTWRLQLKAKPTAEELMATGRIDVLLSSVSSGSVLAGMNRKAITVPCHVTIDKVLDGLFDKLRISYKDLRDSRLRNFMLKTEFDQVLPLDDSLAFHGLGSLFSVMQMEVVDTNEDMFFDMTKE